MAELLQNTLNAQVQELLEYGETIVFAKNNKDLEQQLKQLRVDLDLRSRLVTEKTFSTVYIIRMPENPVYYTDALMKKELSGKVILDKHVYDGSGVTSVRGRGRAWYYHDPEQIIYKRYMIKPGETLTFWRRKGDHWFDEDTRRYG